MEPERDLYISDADILPPDVDERLHSNTSYWVGAMRYSTWIWTEDGTRLYNYDGYSTLPGIPNRNLSYNSVYECQLQCKENRTFGMSGNKCYCLDDKHTATYTSAGGMQCPGNPEEKCGNASGMSVYTRGTGSMLFTTFRYGVCAFAKNRKPIQIKLDNANNCATKERRFAYYSNYTSEGRCNGSVCLSASSQSWIQADRTSDLIKLNDSTASAIQHIAESKEDIWIGLVLKTSRKWITDKRETSSLSTPTLSPSSGGASTVDPSHPTTDSQSDEDERGDSLRGVIIGLSVSNGIFLLIFMVLMLLQRHRKLRLDRKDANQQMVFNTSTENTTYGLDLPGDNGVYSVITPDTIDGKPVSPPAPTATVNSNIPQPYMNNPATDGHAGPTGLDTSAGGIGEISSEGVQYHILEKRSSTGRGKCDAGLYDHMEATKGRRDTTQQEGNASKVDGSYSHIGAINKGFEECDYDFTNAGVGVNRFDDTYNHTYDKSTD